MVNSNQRLIGIKVGIMAWITTSLVWTGCASSPIDPAPQPSASPGVSLSQAMDPQALEDALLANDRKYQSCYLKSHVRTGGKVMTEFTVGPDGRITVAKVTSSTFKKVSIGNCLIKALIEVQFPRPAGGGTVTASYPFEFK